MRTKCVMAVVVALMSAGSAWAGESRPYLGVLLDEQPLPPLLVKHLQLDEGQGVRIRNVQTDSVADKAGLERDDIVIAFQGKKVMAVSEFVEAVQAADVDQPVSLEIIHLGQRRLLEITLGTMVGDAMPENWKHPPEPQLTESWMPGRVFRMAPGEPGWQQLDIFNHGDRPFSGSLDTHMSMSMMRFKHVEGDKVYDVTITGNPHDADSKVKVVIGDDEYEARVGEVDKLPKDVRRIVDESLKTARESMPRIITPEYRLAPPVPDADVWLRYFRDMRTPDQLKKSEVPSRDEVLERIDKQMKALQERMERYEAESKKMLDKLMDRLERHEGAGRPEGADGVESEGTASEEDELT